MFSNRLVFTLKIIALFVSVFLILQVGESRPLAIMADWDNRELYNIIGIFITTSALLFVYRFFKVSNIIPFTVLLVVILTHFSLSAVLSVGISAFVCLLIGRRFLHNVEWAKTDISLQLAVGYATTAGALQVAVHFPINSVAAYAIASFLVLIILRREVKQVFEELGIWLEMPFNQNSQGLSIVFGLLLSVLLLAAFSETHSDALMVNLRMAHQIKVNGMWSFDTSLYAWADWPKAAAWLQTLHYLPADEQGARLFNVFIVILTVILVVNEAKRLGYASIAWLIAALFLSSPLTFWCAFVLFDDAVFGFFVAAAIISAVNTNTLKNGWPSIIVTIFLASAACATKITGLALAPVILFVYTIKFVVREEGIKWHYMRYDFKNYLLVSLLLTGIAAAPYVFSYYQTGNPVFPLYNDIFLAKDFPSTRFQDLRWTAALGWDIIFRMTARTSEFMEGGNWTFGLQHALFLIPILIHLFHREKNYKLQLYAATLLLFSLIVFSQAKYLRYLYPVLPIYALLIASLFDDWKFRGSKIVLNGLVISICVINLLNVKSLNMYYKFDVKPLAGDDTRRFSEYYEKSLNEFVNHEYGKYSKVLYLHRSYSAGLDGQALNYNWASPNIRSSIDGIKGGNDAFEVISRLGITHIILDKEIADKSPTAFSRSVTLFANLQKQVGSAQLWEVDRKLIPSDFKLRMSDLRVKNYLGQGWAGLEFWGVWATGDSANLSLKVRRENPSSPVRVKAFAMPYFPEGRADRFKASIFTNGKFVQDVLLESKMEQQEIIFLVPANLIGIDGTLNIEFRFSEAFDHSKLQLGFSEIMLKVE